MYQLLLALKYMHSASVIHRDLVSAVNAMVKLIEDFHFYRLISILYDSIPWCAETGKHSTERGLLPEGKVDS